MIRGNPAASKDCPMPQEAVTVSITLIVVFSFFMGVVAYGAWQTALARAGK